MAPGNPGPFVTVAFVFTAVLGGAGVYFSMPSHQHLVKERVGMLMADLSDFEHKVEARLHTMAERAHAKEKRIAARFKALLNKVKGGGAIRFEDIAPLAEDHHDEKIHMDKEDIAKLACGVIAVSAILAAFLVHRMHLKAVSNKGTLTLTVQRANGLTNADSGKATIEVVKRETNYNAAYSTKTDVSDPYVIVKNASGTKHITTDHVKNCLDPEFTANNCKTFNVDCSNKKENLLTVEVWDKRETFKEQLMHSEVLLGTAHIDIAAIYHGRPDESVKKTFPLEGEHNGTVTIVGCFAPTPQKKAPAPAPKKK